MRDDDEHRTLQEVPASVDAEQSLLGALLLDNNSLDRIDDRVSGADFYASGHRAIYAVIRDLIVRGKPADAMTVIAALQNGGDLEIVGGREYIAALVREVPTARNVEHYAAIVRDRSVRRMLIAFGVEVQAMAFARDGRDAFALLDELQRKAGSIAESGLREEAVSLRDLLPGVVEQIEKREASGDALPGLPTGIRDLDARMLGMVPGDLILIAGETSSGKTALAMGIGLHAAITSRVPVAVFSLEMKGRVLAERAIANAGQLNKRVMRTGKLDADDWERFTHGMSKITDAADIFIDPSQSATVERIRARCKRIKRKSGLGLVIVDYIQLMDAPGDNQNEKVGNISRGLKLLANELDCPVIALSQLNRAFMHRADRRPVNSDLRNSGSLEQDADAIVFVYREELHNRDDEDVKGLAELIVSKLREGEPGTVYATFLGMFNKFTDRDQTYRPRPKNGTPPPVHRASYE